MPGNAVERGQERRAQDAAGAEAAAARDSAEERDGQAAARAPEVRAQVRARLARHQSAEDERRAWEGIPLRRITVIKELPHAAVLRGAPGVHRVERDGRLLGDAHHGLQRKRAAERDRGIHHGAAMFDAEGRRVAPAAGQVDAHRCAGPHRLVLAHGERSDWAWQRDVALHRGADGGHRMDACLVALLGRGRDRLERRMPPRHGQRRGLARCPRRVQERVGVEDCELVGVRAQHQFGQRCARHPPPCGRGIRAAGHPLGGIVRCAARAHGKDARVPERVRVAAPDGVGSEAGARRQGTEWLAGERSALRGGSLAVVVDAVHHRAVPACRERDIECHQLRREPAAATDADADVLDAAVLAGRSRAARVQEVGEHPLRLA